MVSQKFTRERDYLSNVLLQVERRGSFHFGGRADETGDCYIRPSISRRNWKTKRLLGIAISVVKEIWESAHNHENNRGVIIYVWAEGFDDECFCNKHSSNSSMKKRFCSGR